MITAINSRALTRAWLGALFGVALACALIAASPARADLAVESFSTSFHEPATYVMPGPPPTLTPVTQAGAHADLTTDFTINETLGSDGVAGPAAAIRNVQVDLPAGFYGNPQSTEICSVRFMFFPGCSVESQVGVIYLRLLSDASAPDAWLAQPIYNIEPQRGETARFGFNFLGVTANLVISVRTDDDNGLRATMRNVNQVAPLLGARLTLWGVPADASHDAERYDVYSGWGTASSAERKPFLTTPTNCTDTNQVGIKLQAWNSDAWVSASQDLGQMTGCDNLSFTPSISVTPDTTRSTTPTGYMVGIDVPQNEDPDGLSTPTLHKVSMSLPDGVALSPSAAWGMSGCSDADAKLGSTDDVSCPETSKLGSVTIDTPLLADQLTGDIYLRSPQPGHQFRLLLTARGPGFVLKIPGEATPDATTGRISAVFDDTPQLPFSSMKLSFRGGDRAPLANPETCGTKMSQADLTPSSGTVVSRSSSFTVTNCAGGFAPSFEAGMLNPFAARFSGFTTTIRRLDGQDAIRSFSLTLPPGLLGAVGSVPLCADAAAAAGTCGADSQVGTTTVESGSGPHPYALGGKVYLAGPYKGAPFSLSVVVPAVAGPFDLGTVVVRASIAVDPTDAKLTVTSDPLPTVVQGVPLRLQSINVTIDRPGFMINPTDCEASQIKAAIVSTAGAVADVASPFQARNCAPLAFKPRMGMRLTNRSQTTDGKHPGLDVLVVQGSDQANLKRVVVALPLSVALDPKNSQSDALCSFSDGLKDQCPVSSEIGTAEAVSPLLNKHLYGKVYLVQGLRLNSKGQLVRTLPTLLIPLRGEINLDLRATSKVDSEGRLVTTFANVPDAALRGFRLQLRGGKKGILVVTGHRNLCRGKQVSEVQTDGQNGKTRHFWVAMKTPCANAKTRAKISSNKRSKR